MFYLYCSSQLLLLHLHAVLMLATDPHSEMMDESDVPEAFRCPACPYLHTIWKLRKRLFPIFTTRSGTGTFGIVSSQLVEVFNSSIKTVVDR